MTFNLRLVRKIIKTNWLNCKKVNGSRAQKKPFAVGILHEVAVGQSIGQDTMFVLGAFWGQLEQWERTILK